MMFNTILLDIVNPVDTSVADEYLKHENFFFFFFTVLFFMNVVAFSLYAFDKHLAVCKATRIPEIVLHLLAILGGAYGAGMAMLLCRHKTRHLTFQIIVPTFFVIWTAVAFYLYVYEFAPSAWDYYTNPLYQ